MQIVILQTQTLFGYDLDSRIDWHYRLPKPQEMNLPAFTATHDEDNRVATWNSQNVTHDVDGNMTFGPLPGEANFVPYSFDARNRLTGVGGVTYQYDAENNRIAKTTAAGVTSYIIDPHGDALPRVLVRERPNESLTYYVYGIGLLYEVDEADNATYYHFDQSGSTVALTNDAGVVTDRVEYTPYGTVSHREGATDTPFLYAGQFGIQQDPNGLLHMRARFYSPELKRFINADPAGFDGGMNWYAYANNSPLMYVDPDGEAAIFAMLVSGAINVAIGYALSGGDYDVRDAAIDFAVGAAFGGLAGRGLSSTRTAGKLYSYSKQASFRGNVFNAKRAGRAWATRHAPGAWAFEGGIKNTAIRAFRTGSLKPFKSYTQFSGPANQAFRPVSAVGPLRGWKRIGGQHFTSRAGNLNLSTGAIARPSIRQSIMYYGDAAIYHSVDAIATGTAMQGASSFIRNQFSTSGGGGWK